MSRRFPQTRDDGSFEVLVRFKGAPHAGPEALQAWLSAWVATNSEWQFLGKTHRFSDFFRSTPQAELGASGELCIRLFGASPDRNFWKDWYVRLVRDTLRQFPELDGLVDVRDADQMGF
jgi:hypothetical protein